MSQFFYSLASFVVALFFICLGILFCFLPESGTRLYSLVQFLLENPWISYLFAALLIAMGTAILINIKLNLKKQYYRIRTGGLLTCLDSQIFEQYLDTYWKELFPKHQVASRVRLKKNKLHIIADLPPVPLVNQKALLQQIENDLNEILMKYLGYHQEYLMSISFQKENHVSSLQ